MHRPGPRSFLVESDVSQPTLARVPFNASGTRMVSSHTGFSSSTFSNDPKFIDKLRDVVGLYVDPPAHAIVLSVDEKAQIQAAALHHV